MPRQDDYQDDELLEDEILDEEGQEEEGDRETVAAVSGWGISIAMHAIVLLLLAFVVIAGRLIEDPVPIKPAVIEPPPPPPEEEKEERDLEEVEVTVVADVEVENPVVHDMEVEVEELETEDEEVSEVAEAKGREEAVSASETGGSGAFMAIGAGGGAAGAFGNRQGGGKKRALGAFGGSKASESAVDAALRWFKRHQSPNGMWDIDGYPVNCEVAGPKCEPGTDHTGADGDAAGTGYAVLAFLGAGYDHRTPNKYRRTVKNGIDWLVANQKADGSFGNSRNYENGVCTMALAEAFAMSNDPELREPAQKGVDYLLSVQNGQGNGYGGLGWDYTKPKARNDSSVSGWAIMALKSAQAGGLNVGQGMEGAKQYLEKAWNAANNNGEGITDHYEDRSGFPYTWDSESGAVKRGDPSPDKTGRKNSPRTSIGLCIGVFLGKGQGNLMMETMANDVIKRSLEEGDPYYQVTSWPVNTYYLYYSTLGVFQVGGERWQRWNNVVRDLLVENQRKSDDCFDGSWDFEGSQFHGYETGRIISTAYCALSLQVYYRYVPINK